MGAFRIFRRLQDLLDVNPAGLADNDVPTWDAATSKFTMEAGGGGGGGAPTNADYLVGTADATLSNEIVVGVTPGGELGNTWASPTVDTIHSGSSHAATQAAAEAASVILAPASSARNVIQPTAGAVIAAIVKAHAAQSVSMMEWQDSAGAVLGSVGPAGGVIFAPSDTFLNSLVLIQPPVGFGNDSPSGYLLEILNEGGTALLDLDIYGEMQITAAPGSNESAYVRLNPEPGTPGNVGYSFEFSSSTSLVDIPFIVATTPPANVVFIVRRNGAVEIVPDDATVPPLLLRAAEINVGTGSPETVVTAPVGSLFLRTDGAAGTTFYVKESGAGNTGWAAVGGASGAPTTATYITQTPDAGLSAEQALSALATGLVKNTTGTGVLSIGAQGTDYWAPGGTDVAVADGGTGASTAAGARTNLGVIAANVPFTPAGTIAATDVQAAIEEVASEAGGGGIATRTLWLPDRNPGVHGNSMSSGTLGSGANTYFSGRADDALNSSVYWTFVIPADALAAQALTATVFWAPSATDATSLTVRWQFMVKKINVGVDVTGAGTATAFTGSNSNKTANTMFSEAAQSVLASVTAGDLIQMELRRVGGDAGDTYTGSAHIGGVLLSYTAVA